MNYSTGYIKEGPCLNCKNRAWDCHGKCQKYLDHKKKSDEKRIKVQQNIFYNNL